MASAPSLSEETATSFRVSIVRTGEEPDTAWLAEFDELPNCSGRGSSPEEAVRRAWAAATMSTTRAPEREPDARPAPRHSGKLLVRMPASLHDELALAAESEGVSLNQLITGALAGAVEWRSADSAAEVPADNRWPRRMTPIVLVANFAVVLFAAVVAIAVLVVALSGGG